jgi:hypothetical protein
MILEGEIYCEGPDCNVSEYVNAAEMNEGILPVGWYHLIEYEAVLDREHAFCSTDCIMKWAWKNPREEMDHDNTDGETEEAEPDTD